MTDEQLLDDFIDFMKKQLHYGSSKAPLLDAMIGDYTSYKNDVEKITAGLHKLNAIVYNNGNAVIDMNKNFRIIYHLQYSSFKLHNSTLVISIV